MKHVLASLNFESRPCGELYLDQDLISSPQLTITLSAMSLESPSFSVPSQIVQSRAEQIVVCDSTNWRFLRAHERVAFLYFSYLAILGLLRPLSATEQIYLLATPALLYSLCLLESRTSLVWTRIAREWCFLGLILPGYWFAGWFESPFWNRFQQVFIQWDRSLFTAVNLQTLIETIEWIPVVLEFAYLMLYVIPFFVLGLLYAKGSRNQAPRFLLILLLGTFSVYALLPHSSVSSPRIAFPTDSLPSSMNVVRRTNLWILDHLDNSKTVFPSGHVAVAFSSAFGLRSCLPDSRWLHFSGFVGAILVYVATVHGRYHYAADGIASAGIAFVVWWVVDRIVNVAKAQSGVIGRRISLRGVARWWARRIRTFS